jgi:hypothetical protein
LLGPLLRDILWTVLTLSGLLVSISGYLTGLDSSFMFTDIGQGKKNMESYEGREKIIFFLGTKPGEKNFLQTNGVFLCLNHVHEHIVF